MAELVRTIRKGEAYENAVGGRMHAPGDGVIAHCDFLSVESIAEKLAALGWECRRSEGKEYPMGSGIVVNGQAEQLDGLVVQNYLDNAHLRLAPGDRRARLAREKVCAIVLHTTKGIPTTPGHKDERPQDIRPGVGESSRAGERIVGSWTLDPRPAGAHLIVDFDGRAYCCADLATEAAYHAGLANGASIGIEIMQGSLAELYEGQLEVAVALVLALCRRFNVLPRIPLPYQGHPVPALTGHLDGIGGVFGHRDLTGDRGLGDPGDAIMERLAAAGFERWDYAA